MLRFDIPPVFSNVIRWEAFLVFCVCIVALSFSPWVLIIFSVQGFIKGFFGHHKCPSHLLWQKIFTNLDIVGKKENAGAKIFAGKILFVVSSISFTLFIFDNSFWKVPCSALMIFSFLEWAFSFCAACWVYGAWYKYFPPKNV